VTSTLHDTPDTRRTHDGAVAVHPLTGWIGAQIDGVDLAQPLTDDQVRQIREALLRWKVVFFRGQELDHAAHVRFAEAFGDPTPAHPLFDSVADENFPTVYPVFRGRKKARYADAGFDRTAWHADVTAALNPPAASILRAEVIPPYGGDTQWSNMVVAYEQLSKPVRDFVDGLRAVHRFSVPEGAAATSDYQQRLQRRPLVTEHPVVRVHPETGERALYVNSTFTQHIVGLSPRESRHILELLYEHIGRPEFTVRFKWEPGSVAFWDNRSTVHLAPSELEPVEGDRRLFRVTLVGDVPVGPDHQPSTALEGEPFAALATTA
jgi:alpha-ketoglutarate-dependent sulfate ester dioxygenase